MSNTTAPSQQTNTDAPRMYQPLHIGVGGHLDVRRKGEWQDDRLKAIVQAPAAWRSGPYWVWSTVAGQMSDPNRRILATDPAVHLVGSPMTRDEYRASVQGA